MGRGFAFAAIVLLTLAPVAAGKAHPAHIQADPGAAWPDDAGWAARIVALHNRERARLGLAELTWDDALANDAAQWARALAVNGHFEHAPHELRRGEGENLFRGTAGAYTIDEMIGDFLDERAGFRGGRFPDVAGGAPWESVGHYTQIIWRDTRKVGCALARGGEWDVLACRYLPAGNVYGVRVP